MSVVTLDEVETQSARHLMRLRFSPRVEALFRRDYVDERLGLVTIWGIVGVIVYDLIYFPDRVMVPDALLGLIVARFFLFTPLVVICIWAVKRWPDARLYDILSVFVAVMGVTLPMIPATTSSSPYLYVYQTYNAAAFLFFVICLRPRFPAILAGLALMCLSHFTTTYLTGAFDQITYTGIVSFYLTLSIFLALCAYFLERTDRRNFIAQLRAGLLHDQLQEKAERDELTGLLNRRSLTRQGDEMWRHAGPGATVSAILLDIDHFKAFNDVHGHIEGDVCIRAVAQCIAATLDESHSIHRFGGEEILILSYDPDLDRVCETAETIRTAIENLSLPHRGIIGGRVTASLGVASARPADLSLEKLLRRADDALYQAKSRGRNIVVVAGAPPDDTQAA